MRTLLANWFELAHNAPEQIVEELSTEISKKLGGLQYKTRRESSNCRTLLFNGVLLNLVHFPNGGRMRVEITLDGYTVTWVEYSGREYSEMIFDKHVEEFMELIHGRYLLLPWYKKLKLKWFNGYWR